MYISFNSIFVFNVESFLILHYTHKLDFIFFLKENIRIELLFNLWSIRKSNIHIYQFILISLLLIALFRIIGYILKGSLNLKEDFFCQKS